MALKLMQMRRRSSTLVRMRGSWISLMYVFAAPVLSVTPTSFSILTAQTITISAVTNVGNLTGTCVFQTGQIAVSRYVTAVYGDPTHVTCAMPAMLPPSAAVTGIDVAFVYIGDTYVNFVSTLTSSRMPPALYLFLFTRFSSSILALSSCSMVLIAALMSRFHSSAHCCGGQSHECPRRHDHISDAHRHESLYRG